MCDLRMKRNERRKIVCSPTIRDGAPSRNGRAVNGQTAEASKQKCNPHTTLPPIPSPGTRNSQVIATTTHDMAHSHGIIERPRAMK